MKLFVRWFLGLLVLGSASCSHALVFAINEGVTYRVTNEEIRAKYTAIAADLSKLLKQPVTVEPVSDYPTLRKGLADREYALAIVHPAHLSIEAMKKSGYQLVAVIKGYEKYTASFMVKPDSPLKTLADLRSNSLGLPAEDSITAWMVRATLRDALGVQSEQVKYYYTRYQDAVPFFIDNNLTKAGATASGGVVKAWEAKGGKIIGKSPPVPIKHVIAGPSLTADQIDKVRDYLLTLDATEDGRKKLAATKYAGFAAYDQAAMLRIGSWLGL